MTQLIETQFEKMGARARMEIAASPRTNGRFAGGADPQPVRVNVRRDAKCEFFEITHRRDVDVTVVDLRRSERHLLLMAREPAWLDDGSKSKFLCGFDERAWFVAAVPETATVRNVQDAKDALKPAAVWESIQAHGVRPHQRDRRWTKAFVRQGEWFFIPRPEARFDPRQVLYSEPIRRGRGKPHTCQFLYRTGGEQVWVSTRYPNGLTAKEYQSLDPSERNRGGWRNMTRGARVYVRGAIRHADHKTIWLPGWHEVVMNTETQAQAMRHVAFLD